MKCAQFLVCCMVSIAAQKATAGGLEDLEWLAGHWVSADGAAEEIWLPPRGGTMTGTFRWVFPNGRQVLEFLVVEETDDGVWLRWKHFNTDYEAWEKDAPNIYRLSQVTDRHAVFDRTSDNDKVPLKYSYSRQGDALIFRGEGEAGEEPLVLEFRLRAKN